MNHATVGWLRGAGLVRASRVADDFALPPIVLDSRKIKPGETFWALRGNRDGHEYVGSALDNGAKAVVVDEAWASGTQAGRYIGKCVVVADTQQSLVVGGAAWRREFRGEVIGITGSNGKTSTKDILLAVLRVKYRCGGTIGNLNNQLGVPLTLLNLPNDLDYAVIEMGASYIGEIADLCRMSDPNHGLVTSISKAHLSGFGELAGVAFTKGQLYDHIASRGSGFVPVENELCRVESAGIHRRVGYGFRAKPEDWSGNYVHGTELRFDNRASAAFRVDSVAVRLNVPGRPAAQAALAAIAIGKEFGLSASEIAPVVESWQGVSGRTRLIEAAGIRVLDDSYNANPESAKAALDTLAMTPAEFRIAVLGEMAELGDFTIEEHRNLLKYASKLPLSRILLVGRTWEYLEADAYSDCREVSLFSGVSALIDSLKESIRGGDLILFKGSRSSRLDEAVASLAGNSI